MSEATTYTATGRRKSSVARAWVTSGSGRITINNRPFEEYVPTVTLQNSVLEPFQKTKLVNKFDVKISVKGGGIAGQVGAIRLAISRSLLLPFSRIIAALGRFPSLRGVCDEVISSVEEDCFTVPTTGSG